MNKEKHFVQIPVFRNNENQFNPILIPSFRQYSFDQLTLLRPKVNKVRVELIGKYYDPRGIIYGIVLVPDSYLSNANLSFEILQIDIQEYNLNQRHIGKEAWYVFAEHLKECKIK